METIMIISLVAIALFAVTMTVKDIFIAAITYKENKLKKDELNKIKPSAEKQVFDNLITLDKYTTEAYLKILEKSIQYESIYQIDVMTGKTFADKKAITDEIDTDTLNKIGETVKINVYRNMSQNMKDYLSLAFGPGWLVNYINIYAMSMLINYSKLNIESIVRSIKK